MMLPTSSIGPGFADATRDSQSVFRAILSAMSRPGHRTSLAASCGTPDGLPPAAALALLTLVDYETPVWLPPSMPEAIGRWLIFHTGAPVVGDPASARFAVLAAAPDAPRLSDFHPGEDRYPDKSATLLVLCDDLEGGEAVVLSGPGIRSEAVIAPHGLPDGFWSQWDGNHARYPLGVDALLVAGGDAIGLPRSTHARRRGGA